MPYPNPRVFTALLNEYLYVRSFTWNSTKGWVASLWKDDATIKTVDCYNMNQQFYVNGTEETDKPQIRPKLYSLPGWIELLNDLGKAGNEDNAICGTYHAIRTYIIAKLLDSEHKGDFLKEIADLRVKTEELDKKISQLMADATNENDIGKMEKEYNDNLILLANLGHKRSIADCVRKGFFAKLSHPKKGDLDFPYYGSLNFHFPSFYQDNYFRIHYQIFVKTLNNHRNLDHNVYTFEEFENKNMTGTTKINRELTKQNSSGGIWNAIGGMWGAAKPSSPTTEPAKPNFSPAPAPGRDN